MIHALEAMRAISEARRKMLTRRCPDCAHEQLTPEEKLSEPVACEKCGTPTPAGRGVTPAAREAAETSEGEPG